MKERAVFLNEAGEWLLFRSMVCGALDKNPHAKKIIDCDPWEYSSALDMSFEETKVLPLDRWQEQIAKDLQEMIDMHK